ncbi:MAG: LppX_LprAFG lipoprotein [Lachnospiraceae bacterium]|nr:LppX_LprAFG lipoprotein [Lachnospiraceae bacterium]
MRKKRQIAIWMLVVALVAGMVSGCGKKEEEKVETVPSTEATQAPTTAKELVTRARDTLSSAASVKGKLSMEMVMDYKAQGVETTLEYTMKQTVEMVREPEAVHMTGTVDINLAGLTMDTETYTVIEDGQYVTYTGISGQWTRQAEEAGAGEQGAAFNAAKTVELLLKTPDALSLEEVETEGGQTLYKITGVVTGEDLSGLMQAAGNLIEEDADAYKALEANVTLLVDGGTGLPAEISMDFTDSYNTLMQANKEIHGFDEVKITAFSLTMSDYEVDCVAEITVPEDVKTKAAVTEEVETVPEETADPEEPESEDLEITQNEKGEYILETGWEDSTAVIACPDGFVYNESSEKSWLGFDRKEHDDVHDVSLVYHLYHIDENYGEADIAQIQETSYTYMSGSGDYAEVSFEPVQTVTAAGKTISYTKLSYIYMGTIYCEEYNSWTVLPDGRMIQCTIKEESREEPCDKINVDSIFETAFAAVKES